MPEITDYTQYLPPPVSPEEAKGAEEKYIGSLEKSQADLESKAAETQRQRMSLVKGMPTGARPPQLAAPPPTPKMDFSEPIKAFQNPAVVLATLGSLFSRAPMTAALNAGGAAMEAYHKGEAEQFKQKQQEWEDNLKLAQEQNKRELEKYHAIMENAKLSTQQKMAEINAIGAGFKDQIMLDAGKTGIYKAQYDIVQARIKANDMIAKSLIQADAQKRRGGQKEMEHKQQVDSVINQIEEAQALIKKHPSESLVGLGGTANRALEFVMGGSDMAKFEQLISAIQAQTPKLLTGRVVTNKEDRARIDKIVPGFGYMKNTEQAYEGLNTLKTILQKKDLFEPSIGSEIPDRVIQGGIIYERQSDGSMQPVD